MTKIIDLIQQKRDDGKPHVSVEYFPPRTAEGVQVCRLYTIYNPRTAATSRFVCVLTYVCALFCVCELSSFVNCQE